MKKLTKDKVDFMCHKWDDDGPLALLSGCLDALEETEHERILKDAKDALRALNGILHNLHTRHDIDWIMETWH